MSRSLLSVFVFLSLTLAFASPFSQNNSLKRKIIQVNNENSPKQSRITENNIPSPFPSQSKWVIRGNVDMHPPSLPQPEKDMGAYMALFLAISRRDLDAACLLLSVFPDLKLTRYFEECNKKVLMNFYHLAFMAYRLDDFKIIVSFGDENELLYPTSKGSGLVEIARSMDNQEKIEYVRSFFSPRSDRLRELKEKVVNGGLVSLFVKDQL